MEFMDRIQLAHHPEIFIPENVASLPNWNAHAKRSEIERRLNCLVASASNASVLMMSDARPSI